MRIYETIYICPPTMTDEQMDDFSDTVREIIIDGGGNIIKQEKWGKKRLAYVIQHYNDGHYFYFLYGGETVNIDELERRLRLSEECIRFLTVRLDKELKGKKHKIFTQEELALALNMGGPVPEKREAADDDAEATVTEAAEAPVVEAVEAPAVEEAPVEETVESPVEEAAAPVEEVVEAPVEEAVAPVEEVVEATAPVEAPAEEKVAPVVETKAEEAPAEETIEEAKADETDKETTNE